MADHAACSPSSAATWMSCPASITLAEGRTRPSSRYAMEGTAAHMIAEMILGGEIFPPGKVTVEGKEFVTGMHMIKTLRPYLDYVRALSATATELYCETRVAVNYDSGLVWGTTDCAALTGTRVDIVDLKFGKGIAVKPDTPQLKIYGVAAMDTLWRHVPVNVINLTVVQPRVTIEPQTHTMSVSDLRRWSNLHLLPAIRRIEDGDTTENAGSWCRFCVRKNDCVAFSKHKNSNAAEAFEDDIDPSE